MTFFYIFILILIEHSVASSGVPDQTPRSVASDLGLECTPMSHKKDAMIIWVYNNPCSFWIPVNRYF